MKHFWLGLTFLFCAAVVQGQLTRYIVQFRYKGGSTYTLQNPAAYLSPASIERRTRHLVPLDSTDLPVNPQFIESVRQAGDVTIINASRWLNSLSIQTTDAAAIEKILQFPFVSGVKAIAARQRLQLLPNNTVPPLLQKTGMKATAQTTDVPFDYGTAAAQINIHNGAFLHNLGLRGQGIGIGMLDAGYYNYTTLRSFDSMNKNGQVRDTWDFVARHAAVAEDHQHGMQCLSIIAANIPGQFVGSAPKAHFYLYRTEDVSSEYPIEEHNWVCAAERVDSAGGQIISSSLGYATFDDASLNHTYADMNGNTTMAAIGADLAAKKGILVVVAAGNEGANSWKYIMTPADADSVLTVGAVNKEGHVAPFSSYGPAADGRVKPDVVSVGVGTTIQNTNNTIGSSNGTSFACPNMAGLAACLWQGFPQASNMRIILALKQASIQQHGAWYDRVGYGLPDLKKAFLILLKEEVTASAALNNCAATLSWRSKDAAGMRYEIERKTAADAEFKMVSQLVVSSTSNFSTRQYQYNDPLSDQVPGAIQYRIRQVVDTALATYSSIYIDTVTVNVAMACNSTARPLVVFPNPVQNQMITLQVNNAEPAEVLLIQVHDAAGKLAYEKRASKGAAISVFPLPAYQLPPGKYFITVYQNGKRLATETFVRL